MAAFCIVVLLLAASPATPIRLGSPGIASVNVTPELQNFVTDHLNQQLVLAGVDVLSSSQVAAVLGLERQKQLLGCTATNDCLAEFANALGVDGLVLGNLAKFGTTFQLDVRVAAASDAHNLAIVSIRIPDESGLLDAISQAAAAVAKQLSEALKISLAPVAQPTAAAVAMKSQFTTARTVGMWTFVGSSALLIAGSACALIATPAPSPPPAPTPRTNDGLLSAGTAMIVLGLPGMVIGGLIWIFGGSEQVPIKASLFPTRDGFGFALGGTF